MQPHNTQRDVYDDAIDLIRKVPKPRRRDIYHELWNNYWVPIFFNLREYAVATAYPDGVFACSCPTVTKLGSDHPPVDERIKEFIANINISPAYYNKFGTLDCDVCDDELEMFAAAQRFADEIYPGRYDTVEKLWSNDLRGQVVNLIEEVGGFPGADNQQQSTS